MSAILRELARPPEVEVGGGWPQLRPGSEVGRFEIVREIGRGGFGVVYEALDHELGRSVAFKAVRAGDRPPLREERVLQEAEAAARLSHPNIVTLFDVGRTHQGPYLVLELLHGETLAERLERGPIPVGKALQVAVEVAKGLAHAHVQGVVHRDLTPRNIFLCEDGSVKVLDFGLAHAFGHRRAPGGTPGCMAPEQWKGAPEDERTDVFALGVVLYRMLSGALPFPDHDGGKAVLGHRAAPALEVPAAPPLGGLVSRMVAKDPVERPRDGVEVLAALSALEREPAPNAGGRPEPVRRRSRHRLRLALLAVAGLIAGAAISALLTRQRAPPVPVAASSGGVVVAVADCANETGEGELDALSGLLITSLEQSKRLSVLTRPHMLDLARQAGRGRLERIDEVVGREVGRAAGARALLVLAVRRFDQVYTLELRALDPRKDEYLFSLKELAPGKSSIPEVLDRLSERARRALNEEDADVAASRLRVAEALTPSLEAYQHYFLAEQLANEEFDPPAALAEYRRSLEADPQFALPHLAIALMAVWHEVPEEDEDAHVAAAARQATRLPDRERRLLFAVQHLSHRDFSQAIPILRALAVEHPGDTEVLYLTGDALWHSGLPFGPGQAASFFRRSLDVDPRYLPASIHLFQWLGRFGPAGEALARARRADELRPLPVARVMVARALASSGDMAGALEAARQAAAMAGGSHFQSSVALAEVLFGSGRTKEAEQELRRWLAPDALAGHRRLAGEFLPVLLATEGRRREALALLHDLVDLRGGVEYEYGEALMRAHLALAGGDERGALAALRAWKPRDQAAVDPHAWLWAFAGDPASAARRAARLPAGSLGERRHAGVAALRRGRFKEAVLVLEELTRRDPALEPVFLLGLALAGAGRDADAIAAFQTLGRTHPFYFPYWQASLQPWSLYLAARSHERLGRREAARRELDQLLSLWSRADPDLPLLAEAKAMRMRLANP